MAVANVIVRPACELLGAIGRALLRHFLAIFTPCLLLHLQLSPTAYCRALLPFRLLLSLLRGLHAFSDTLPHLRTSVWFATTLGGAQHRASPSSRVIAISAWGQAVMKGQSKLISRVDSDTLSSFTLILQDPHPAGPQLNKALVDKAL